MLNDGFFGLYKAECAAGLGENLALFWGRGGVHLGPVLFGNDSITVLASFVRIAL